MRGGIAEKGGVRVGHRIIEINSKLFIISNNLLQLPETETNSSPNSPQTYNPNSTKILFLDESVVATQHDKIVHLLVTSVGEIHMKTMPAAMFRLLTGQDQPLYL